MERIAIVEEGAVVPSSDTLALPSQHIVVHHPDETLEALSRRVQRRTRELPAGRTGLLLLGEDLTLEPRLRMLQALAQKLVRSSQAEVQVRLAQGAEQRRLGWRILESIHALDCMRNVPVRLQPIHALDCMRNVPVRLRFPEQSVDAFHGMCDAAAC